MLPEEIARPTERFGEGYTNRTIDFMFNTASVSADISAELTYRYRDSLTWGQISLIILFITVAPPVAFLYAAITVIESMA
jgi:maltodextrin utilization protein YvdJ